MINASIIAHLGGQFSIVVLLLMHGELLIKKQYRHLYFLRHGKKGDDSLVFGMYYLLSKRCFDLCIIYMLTKKAEILIVSLELAIVVVGRSQQAEQTTTHLIYIAQKSSLW